MQQYFITISILVLLYEVFILFQSWRQGQKVGSAEATKHTFIRTSFLMLVMAALLTVYQFIKLNFMPDFSVIWELVGLFVIVIFIAMKTEGYYSKRPLYFEKDDNALILTSVKNPLDLTRLSGVQVNGSRIVVVLVGRPPRSIHLNNDKVRKEIVRKLRARVRQNKAGK